MFELSKTNFMEAKNKFNNLMGTDLAARNPDHYTNELLSEIIKICVGDSLVPLRVQMMKGQCRLSVNYKIPTIPSIDVTPIPK